MNQRKQLIAFACIAKRDVHFFLKAAERIRQSRPDFEIVFISFFQAGNSLVKELGFGCIDLYAYSKNFDFDLQEVSRFETSYHIENMQQMLTHERYTL